MTDSQEIVDSVTTAADAAGLHAPAPTMLLELQSLLGALGASALAATEGGRRPFRADPTWGPALGALGFAVYNLADQTGVDLTAAILDRAAQLRALAPPPAQQRSDAWPFGD